MVLSPQSNILTPSSSRKICIVPAVPIKSVFYGRQCWYRSPGTWEALNVPDAHGRRSFSFQIWFLETNKAGQYNKFKRRPIAVPRFIGRPVRATPNHKMEAASSVQQKDKMADGTPRRLWATCPIPYQWGQFLRRGDWSFQVIWGTELIDLERAQNYCVELLSLYLCRMII